MSEVNTWPYPHKTFVRDCGIRNSKLSNQNTVLFNTVLEVVECFYAPATIGRGHIVLPLSVRPSVRHT